MTGGSCVIDDEDPRPQSTASALAHRGASATLVVFRLLEVLRDVAGSRCEFDGAVGGPCFGSGTLWDEVALQGNDNLRRSQVFSRSMRSGSARRRQRRYPVRKRLRQVGRHDGRAHERSALCSAVGGRLTLSWAAA